MNFKKPSISIVIPCFNIQKNKDYINHLLRSIYNQNFRNVELEYIYLINDYPQCELIQYIDNINLSKKLVVKTNIKNSGQAFSRNIGLSFVSSDYVHFIDQDDFIHEDFYINFLFDKDIMIAKCILYKNQILLNHLKYTKEFILKYFNKIASLRFFLIFDNIVLSPGQVIFRTNILKKIGGFPELINFGSDDFGLMYNLTQHDFSYSYSNNSIFYHRLHETQGKKFLNMNASRKEFLNVKKRNLFNVLCKIDSPPVNILKKILYIFFYNRL
jgi:glycosyltransferase involved in cell wall biosynthesis